MDLFAFAITIIVILAILFILGIILLIAERNLEKKLVKKGHPANLCKAPGRTFLCKKKPTAEVEESTETEESAAN